MEINSKWSFSSLVSLQSYVVINLFVAPDGHLMKTSVEKTIIEGKLFLELKGNS